MILYIDNIGAKDLANNQMISQKLKHIDIKYHFIRECIEDGKVKLKACASSANTVDAFTKPLPTPRFRECQMEMGVFEIRE